jgi:prolyl 4-hydroxylase
MQYESLATDLKSWLEQSLAQGHARDTLVQTLRAGGYAPKFARQAVDLALARQQRQAAAMVPAPVVQPAVADAAGASAGATAVAADDAHAEHPATANTHDILVASPNAIATSDRTVEILMVLNAPRIVLFGGLLSDEECDEMRKLSAAKLQRSTVVNAATGAYDVHPDRTSSGTHFDRGENPLVKRIENRISELVGYPVENGEPIQILHYQPGGEYKPHFDYFDPKHPGNDKVLAMGGQRVATLIMYLNDVTAGGSTVFPEVGVDILPRKGNAVYFAYTTPEGALDARSLHGGSPVSAGEKWIATKWLRQRAYGGPGA